MPLPAVVRAPASTAPVSISGHKRPHQHYHHQVYYRPYRSLHSLSGGGPVEEGPVEEEELEGSPEARFVYSEGGVDTGSEDDEGDALIFVPGGSSSGLDWEPGVRLLRLPEGLLAPLSMSAPAPSHGSLVPQPSDITRLQQLHAQLSGGDGAVEEEEEEEERGSKRRRDEGVSPPPPVATRASTAAPPHTNTHATDPAPPSADQGEERGRRRKSRRTTAATDARSAAATGGSATQAPEPTSTNTRLAARTTRRRQLAAAAASAGAGGSGVAGPEGSGGGGDGGSGLAMGVAALRRRRRRRDDDDHPPLNGPTTARHTTGTDTHMPPNPSPSQPPSRLNPSAQSFVLRSEAVGGSSLDAMMLRVLGEYGLSWQAMPLHHPALQGQRNELPPQ